MHTGKRTRTIRLNKLKTAYWELLYSKSFDQLAQALQAHTVLPRELEAEVWDYYRRTVPSLQEFYSRYTPEWEQFYEVESLLPSDFFHYLRRMSVAFSRRYSLTELNVAYYIDRFRELPLQGEERKWLKELFLDRWFQLLTRKEYDYQYHHLEELCRDFVILDKTYGLKTASQLTGSRLRWLLLNWPQLYRQVVTYEKEIKKHRAIQELIRVLGQQGKGEKPVFDALSGMSMEQWVHPAAQTDIVGITLGDDLSHLLPVEYCYLSESSLYPEFLRRFHEKRLQMIDSRSMDNQSVPRKERRKAGGNGPFIVCLDTSGSMQGRRERLAKSALLAVAQLTESTHRECYVINFAEEVQCMRIQHLKEDLPLLVEFLNHRFDGGTDLRPAMDEALSMMERQEWRQADVVWISDFELPPASEELTEAILRQQQKGTSFYALVFGGRPEMDYLNFCSRYWEFPSL